MNELPYELFTSILKYIEYNDLILTSSKHCFLIRKLIQIVINNKIHIYKEDDIDHKFCLNAYLHRGILNKILQNDKIKKIRTRRIIIDHDNFDISKFVDNFKNNYECLKIRFCYTTKMTMPFPLTLKSLIVSAFYEPNNRYKSKILDIVLPDSLIHLIIPNSYMVEYPKNLEYLKCSLYLSNDENQLPKLKTLVITFHVLYTSNNANGDNVYERCQLPLAFPKNLEVLEFFNYDKLPNNLPPHLRKIKICSYLGKPQIISYFPITMTTLVMNNYADIRIFDQSGSLFMFDKIMINMKCFSYKVSRRFYKNDIIDIVNNFPNLTSLSIDSQFGLSAVEEENVHQIGLLNEFDVNGVIDIPLDTWPKNLKKLKWIVNTQQNMHSSEIKNLPDTMTHLTYNINSMHSSYFNFPLNLKYLKLHVKNNILFHGCFTIPESIIMLDTNMPQIIFPLNLIYLNYSVLTNEKTQSRVKHLTKLKYLSFKTRNQRSDMTGTEAVSAQYQIPEPKNPLYLDAHKIHITKIITPTKPVCRSWGIHYIPGGIMMIF